MNIAVAHPDLATRERLADAFRKSGWEVHPVADVVGVVAAAVQARLSAVLLEAHLLAREVMDLRTQLRTRASYLPSLYAIGQEPEAVERHGANAVPPEMAVDEFTLAAWLREDLVKRGGLAPAGGAGAGRAVVLARNGKATILVVEDEPSFRLFVGDALAESGYAVWSAANGSEALTLLQTTPVDLVISDINMPGMSGFELKRAVDASREKPMPFILMTADSQRNHAEMASAIGVVFVLAKPIRNLDALYAIIEEALHPLKG